MRLRLSPSREHPKYPGPFLTFRERNCHVSGNFPRSLCSPSCRNALSLRYRPGLLFAECGVRGSAESQLEPCKTPTSPYEYVSAFLCSPEFNTHTSDSGRYMMNPFTKENREYCGLSARALPDADNLASLTLRFSAWGEKST